MIWALRETLPDLMQPNGPAELNYNAVTGTDLKKTPLNGEKCRHVYQIYKIPLWPLNCPSVAP